MRATAALLLVVMVLVACGAPATLPTPTVVPTPVPTATFRPAVPPTAVPPTRAPTSVAQSVSDINAPPSDVENAFLSNIDDFVGVVTDVAVSSCDDLVAATRARPDMVISLRGFAATLKRASATQSALNTDAVKSALADLDNTMAQLDGALSQCGIPVPTPTTP